MNEVAADFVVVGGGFYGCVLSLFLRSLSDRVILLEAGTQLMERASRVNQARVHTGFHYPRSALTAVKSMVLHRRFARDFPDAIVSDFQMIYAIARRRSKISAKRFHRMFVDMNAPISPASPWQAALFDPDTIEAAFACQEYAFDYSILRRHLARRLDAAGVSVHLDTEVARLRESYEGVTIETVDGREFRARFAFNVTFAQTNAILEASGLPDVAVKHELAEIALVRLPAPLDEYGITIMDGPFLSVMPYPSERLHSLTHVRYTPHLSWTDAAARRSAYEVFSGLRPRSRHRHMILDGARYVPKLANAEWVKSLYEVKTVLMKNERDDGRPILYHQHPRGSRIATILGGKIDNVYDLFDLIRLSRPEWRAADERHIHDESPDIGRPTRGVA